MKIKINRIMEKSNPNENIDEDDIPTSVQYVDSSTQNVEPTDISEGINNYNNKELVDSPHNYPSTITVEHSNNESGAGRQNPLSYSWSAPRIVQDDSGLIKKIKISTAKKLVQSFAQHSPTSVSNTSCEDKLSMTPSPHPQQQQQQNHSQIRTSTPLSREYVALQQTQNESKIIKKFVTEAMMERTRNAKVKNLNNSNNTTTAATLNNSSPNVSTTTTTSNDHSYTSRSNNSSHEKLPTDEGETHHHRHKRRFIPIKGLDDDDETSRDGAWRRQRTTSRSKSMNSSENSNSSATFELDKKYPSDESLTTLQQQHQAAAAASKRTNMRSENSEFVQKQREFLQHIINSTQDTPRKTRSRSTGPESTTPPSATTTTMTTTTTPPSLRDKKSRDNSVPSSSSSNRRRSRSKSTEKSTKRLKAGDDLSEHSEISNDDDSHHPLNVGDLDHLRKVWQPPPKPGADSFCWKCHDAAVDISCIKCIRSFHTSCIKAKIDSSWICTECSSIENILNSSKKSRRNELSVDLLSQLLTFALKRMRFAKGNYTFVMPYEKTNTYKKYIVNPVHFGTLQEKINAKEYHCAEELVNDTKWMLHNAYIISAGNNSKLVQSAKNILKICRQEAIEIETCAECYLNANTRTDWFVDVCSQPHLLLWAKLKGFPYWPAKAMSMGQTSVINVRFFGEHDRAFVSAKDCFLYSEQDPNTQTGKKAARELAGCMKEVEEHIEKIRNKIGGFQYAPFKTPFDPNDVMRQLEEMMPGVQEFMRQQQVLVTKTPLQFKIYRTADNNMSIVQKASSTPDLVLAQQQQQQQQQQHDVVVALGEDSHASSKKRKPCPANIAVQEDERPLNEKQATLAAKYEVISKTINEDSRTSKLGTVILKRKSDSLNGGGEGKKTHDHHNTDNDDEDTRGINLPKLQRIEEVACNELAPAKKKNEMEKMKSGDNVKPMEQQKIPILTIKTNTITSKDPQALEKDSQPRNNLEKVSQTKEATNVVAPSTQSNNDLEKETSRAKEKLTSPPSAATTTAQKVVENLVKNKQGVTIKKITNNANNNTPMPEPAAESQDENNKPPDDLIPVAKVPEKPKEKPTPKTKSSDKNKQDQQVNIILKGLVPFVEIKQEVTSDNEEETQPPPPPAPPTPKDTSTDNVATTEKPLNVPQTRSFSKETLSSQSNSPQKETTINGGGVVGIQSSGAMLLVRVKEELFSDEEAEERATAATMTEATTVAKNTNEIRVVGDTTIQKISMKNTQQVNNTGNNKRNVLKGVPYGPLPASAFAQLSATDSTSNESQTRNAAGTSSGNTDKPVASSTTTAMDMLNPKQINSNSNQEACIARSISSNTMVTIPVDIASTTRSIMSPIPVPPLTAVSKTISHSSQTFNSMARHNPVTVTVSGTAGSLSTPLIMLTHSVGNNFCSFTATTANTIPAIRTITSSPITVTNNSTRVVASTNTSMAAPLLPLQNSIYPLRLTTPPPLAGLSGVNLNSNLHNDIVGTPALDTTSTTLASSTPALNTSTDTQIPPLRIATPADVTTNRILPRLTPRPKLGIPQTAETRSSFPPQAGPVHTRLFENAFRVTYEFMNAIEDTIRDLTQHEDTSLAAKLSLATIELETSRQGQEELRKQLEEMRKNMEIEKNRVIAETRKQCQLEQKQRELEWQQRELEWKRVVEETKRKQWCAQCGREAKLYCCWNTSYCDVRCQDMHWARHGALCVHEPTTTTTTTTTISNQNNNGNNLMANSSGLQMQMQHNPNSSSAATSLIIPANVNTKTTGPPSSSPSPSVALKKEKSLGKKSSANNLLSSASQMSSMVPASASSSSQRCSNNSNSAELLKLPTNTFLRQVVIPGNQQTVRCNTTYSIPVQRYNVQTITTPANSANLNYPIVPQANNRWIMNNTGTVNNVGSVGGVATNHQTIAAPMAKKQNSRSTGGGGKTNSNRQMRYH